MIHTLLLIAGSCFLAGLLYHGWRLRRAGHDLRGKPPVSRPLFVAGKAAMGLLWGLALWQAAAALTTPGVVATVWLSSAGSLLFAAGCCISLIAFIALGRELRFGLPTGRCQLKTEGIYRFTRHPIYSGFFLMCIGAALYLGTALAWLCLLLAIGIHHLVARAEERFLAQAFGNAWQTYAARVPRYGFASSRGARRWGHGNAKCD